MRLVLCIILCAFMLISCENRDHSHITTETTSTNETEYGAIKALGYIGGAVIYNPESLETSQIYDGADIAFYLSNLEKKTAIDGTVIDENGKVKTQSFDSVVLDQSNDIYGYLHVDRASKNALKLTINTYSKDGSKKTISSCTLEKNSSIDLNGDGKDDLRYTPLLPVRKGFEDAMRLEFISSPEELYTTMFAVMPEGTLSKSAKTLEAYNNKAFYGINSNSDFIYIVSNDEFDAESKTMKSAAKELGISHGDYVIDQNTGDIFAVVGKLKAEAGTYELKETKDYTKSSDDSSINDSNPALLEAFLTYDYDINQFASEEGPKNLVKKLPEALILKAYNNREDKLATENGAVFEPKSALPSRFYENDAEFFVDILNELLLVPIAADSILDISEAEGIPLTEEDNENIDQLFYEVIRAVFKSEFAEQLIDAYDKNDLVEAERMLIEYATTEENPELYYDVEALEIALLHLKASVRTYIERIYPESPKAIVPVPEISTVYPLMSINIGEIPTNLNQFEEYDENGDSSKSAAVSYEDFYDQKKEINTIFEDFYSISLKNIKISDIGKTDEAGNSTPKVEEVKKSDKDKEKPTIIDPRSLHFDLAFGITGSFNSRWGHLDCSLAGAVYVAAGANFSELFKSFELYNEKLGSSSTTFFFGPVPLTLSLTAKFAVDLEASLSSPINYFVGYCGLYGGGVSFNADYGLKVAKNYYIPYITGYVDSTFETEKINYTAHYVGPVDPDAKFTDIERLELLVIPKLKFTPKLAIGPKHAYAGLELPLSIKATLGYAAYQEESLDTDTLEYLDKKFWIKKYMLPGDQYWLFEKLTIGANIKTNPVIGVQIPVINKKIETSWEATPLFKIEMGFRESGFGYIGEFLGEDF